MFFWMNNANLLLNLISFLLTLHGWAHNPSASATLGLGIAIYGLVTGINSWL